MFNFFIDSAQSVSLPTIGGGQDLPAFISSVYSFALTVVGIAVFVQIVRAGFLWLTAAGNVGKAGSAKSMMTNAVVGAILLFAAYMILFTINPDLVKNTFNLSIPSGTTRTPTETSIMATSPTSETGAICCVPSNTPTALKPSKNMVLAQEGIYFFTISVVDANGNVAEQDYSMEIFPQVGFSSTKVKNGLVSRFLLNSKVAVAAENDSLSITTPFVPDGAVGQPYFAEVQAIGGQPPYVYSISNGSLPPGLSLQSTFEMPILTIENLTAQRDPSYFFYQGDVFRLTLTNATPNSPMFFKWQKNGAPWFYPGKTPDANGWTVYGQTDASGRWVNEAPFSAAEIGGWHEWALVDGKMSRPVGFQVVANSINVGHSTTVQPNYTGGGSSTFTPCTLKVYCESKTANPDGAYTTSAPDASGCESQNMNQIAECFYPDQDPNDICRSFDREWRACIEEIGSLTDNDSGQVDTSNLPACDFENSESSELQPGQPCVSSGRTVDGRETRTVRCSYGDQTQAIRCGSPASGGYCLPTYGRSEGNAGCVNP